MIWSGVYAKGAGNCLIASTIRSPEFKDAPCFFDQQIPHVAGAANELTSCSSEALAPVKPRPMADRLIDSQGPHESIVQSSARTVAQWDYVCKQCTLYGTVASLHTNGTDAWGHLCWPGRASSFPWLFTVLKSSKTSSWEYCSVFIFWRSIYMTTLAHVFMKSFSVGRVNENEMTDHCQSCPLFIFRRIMWPDCEVWALCQRGVHIVKRPSIVFWGHWNSPCVDINCVRTCRIHQFCSHHLRKLNKRCDVGIKHCLQLDIVDIRITFRWFRGWRMLHRQTHFLLAMDVVHDGQVMEING